MRPKCSITQRKTCVTYLCNKTCGFYKVSTETRQTCKFGRKYRSPLVVQPKDSFPSSQGPSNRIQRSRMLVDVATSLNMEFSRRAGTFAGSRDCSFAFLNVRCFKIEILEKFQWFSTLERIWNQNFHSIGFFEYSRNYFLSERLFSSAPSRYLAWK